MGRSQVLYNREKGRGRGGRGGGRGGRASHETDASTRARRDIPPQPQPQTQHPQDEEDHDSKDTSTTTIPTNASVTEMMLFDLPSGAYYDPEPLHKEAGLLSNDDETTAVMNVDVKAMTRALEQLTLAERFKIPSYLAATLATTSSEQSSSSDQKATTTRPPKASLPPLGKPPIHPRISRLVVARPTILPEASPPPPSTIEMEMDESDEQVPASVTQEDEDQGDDDEDDPILRRRRQRHTLEPLSGIHALVDDTSELTESMAGPESSSSTAQATAMSTVTSFPSKPQSVLDSQALAEEHVLHVELPPTSPTMIATTDDKEELKENNGEDEDDEEDMDQWLDDALKTMDDDTAAVNTDAENEKANNDGLKADQEWLDGVIE